MRTNTTIGTVITIAPAAIEPVGSSNWELPVKLAIATGAVIAASVAASDNASRRSSAPMSNTSIAASTTRGAADATNTWQDATAVAAPHVGEQARTLGGAGRVS